MKSPLAGSLDIYVTQSELIDKGLKELIPNYIPSMKRTAVLITLLNKLEPKTFGSMVLMNLILPDFKNKKMLIELSAKQIMAMSPSKKKLAVKYLRMAAVFDVNAEELTGDIRTCYLELKNIAVNEFIKEAKVHITEAGYSNRPDYARKTVRLLNESLIFGPEEFENLLLSSARVMAMDIEAFSGQLVHSDETLDLRPLNRSERIISASSDICNLYFMLNKADIYAMGKMLKVMKKPKGQALLEWGTIKKYFDQLHHLMIKSNPVMQLSRSRKRDEAFSKEQWIEGCKKAITVFEENIGAAGMEVFLCQYLEFMNCYQACVGWVVPNTKELKKWLKEKAKAAKNPDWLLYSVTFEQNRKNKLKASIEQIVKMLENDCLSQRWRIQNGYMFIERIPQPDILGPVFTNMARICQKGFSPIYLYWPIIYVVKVPDVKLSDSVLNTLNSYIEVRFADIVNHSKAHPQRDMRRPLACLVVAAQAGDFFLAERIFNCKAFTTKAVCRYPKRYLCEIPESYILLSRYPQMHEFLRRELKKNISKIYPGKMTASCCLEERDLESFLQMLEASPSGTDLLREKLLFLALLKDTLKQDSKLKKCVRERYKKLVDSYCKLNANNPNGTIETFLILPGMAKGGGFVKEFVEFVPLKNAFVAKRNKRQLRVLAQLYRQYFYDLWRKGGDYKVALNLVDQIVTLPPMRSKDELVRYAARNMLDAIYHFIGYDKNIIPQIPLKFAPEQYLSIFEKIRPEIDRVKFSEKYLLRMNLGMIAYFTGRNKLAMELFKSAYNRQWGSHFKPAKCAVYMYLQVLGYGHKKYDEKLANRLIALPNFYNFPRYYSDKSKMDFRQNLTYMLYINRHIQDIGQKLVDAQIPAALKEFENKPTERLYNFLSYYYSSRDAIPGRKKFHDLALEKMPDGMNVNYGAANFYLYLQDWDRVEKLCMSGVRRWPGDSRFDLIWINSLNRQKRYAEAAEYCMSTYQRFRDKHTQQVLLLSAGGSYQKIGEYNKALKAYMKAKASWSETQPVKMQPEVFDMRIKEVQKLMNKQE